MTHASNFKRWMTLLACVAGVASTGSAGAAPLDSDGDGAADAVDNCVTSSNANQRDTDADGYGNLCDADLNNDARVNALDLGLFKLVFNGQSANADLNGDGLINALDLGLLKPLFGLPPGPSNVLLSPALETKPPAVTHTDLFTVDAALPDGSNGAAFYSYGRNADLAPVVSVAMNGRALPLNDLAIEPDLTAGDGIYSGFVTLSKDQLVADEQAYLSRLDSANVVRQVMLYSGRDISAQQAFSVPTVAQAPVLRLPSGIILNPLPLRLPNLCTLAVTLTPGRSLMMTDPSIIADPSRTFDPCDVDGDGVFGSVNGAWSFKTLMANMAPAPLTATSTADFINAWLISWMSDQLVGSSPFTIDKRLAIQNMFPGWDGATSATLNLERLPFRLLAIVNRMDLAGVSLYGTPANPKKSETRLVFGLVDLSSSACKAHGSSSATLPMTVIFEYGDPISNCTDAQARANSWIALSAPSLAFPSALYNSKLQALTDGVTLRNAGAPMGKPNGSALDQLRTNEIALAGPWQLREFNLIAPSSNLMSATIKQTPDPFTFRTGSTLTAQFMEANQDDILCESHVVPDSFLSTPFLGTHADYGFGTTWNAPTTIPGTTFPPCWHSNVSSATLPTKQREVRHKFSLNTCDDCHSGETNTLFTHVDPTTFPSALSGFLTGIVVNDPTPGPLVKRSFNDLQRRGQALESLAQGCLKLPCSFFTSQLHLTARH